MEIMENSRMQNLVTVDNCCIYILVLETAARLLFKLDMSGDYFC